MYQTSRKKLSEEWVQWLTTMCRNFQKAFGFSSSSGEEKGGCSRPPTETITHAPLKALHITPGAAESQWTEGMHRTWFGDSVQLESVWPHDLPQGSSQCAVTPPTNKDWLYEVCGLWKSNLYVVMTPPHLIGFTTVHYTKVQGKNTGFTLYISKIYTE